jgi:antitoxin CptB
MKNKEILKKQIIYRSNHRGTREVDLILGGFVKKYIDKLSDSDLKDLEKFLLIEDEILLNYYFNKKKVSTIPLNNISMMFKIFKI